MINFPDYKNHIKDRLIQHLNGEEDIHFWHLAYIDLSKSFSGGKGKFVRKISTYQSKLDYSDVWKKGLLLLDKEKRSFIEPLYNAFDKKYSLHVYAEVNDLHPESVIISVEDRHIYVEINILNSIGVTIRAESTIDQSGNIGSLISALSKEIHDFETENEAYITDIRKRVEIKSNELICNAIGINSVPNLIRLELKEILTRLLVFLFPDSQQTSIQYSVFIIPGNIINDIELTSGGVVVFWNPIGMNLQFKKKIRSVELNTGLWSNLETINSLADLLHSKSIHAAISQVMSRNLSHNMGSHILSQLTSRQSILSIQKEKGGLSFSADVAILNNYLRDRMDFLADLSTQGVAVLEKEYPISKTIAFMQKNKLVFTNISGNDESLEIKVTGVKDALVSFPNDSLGHQAFFIILENIIRNSAKHGKSSRLNNKGIRLIVNVVDVQGSGLYEVTVFDRNDIKNLDGELEEVVVAQQNRIDRPILEGGMLRRGSWGVLEMKIASAYLRKVDVSRLDYVQPNFPLLTSVGINGEQYSGCFGYRFYLRKPNNILIIYNEDVSTSTKTNEHTIPGCKFVSWQQFVMEGMTYNHKLVVLVNLQIEDIKKANAQKKISHRTIVLTETEFAIVLASADLSGITDTLYGRYRDQLTKTGSSVELSVRDEDRDGSKAIITFGNQVVDTPTVKAEWVWHARSTPKSDYWEPFSGANIMKSLFTKTINGEPLKVYQEIQVIESILIKVSIIDERIQEYGEGDDDRIRGKRLLRSTTMQQTGIFIPLKDKLNLRAGYYEDDMISKLTLLMEEELIKRDYIIIHLGVIEKMLRLERVGDEDKKDRLELFIDKLEGNSAKRAQIIITSGRGQPDTLPSRSRFVHYSNVSQYVVEQPSKLHLTELVFSARQIAS